MKPWFGNDWVTSANGNKISVVDTPPNSGVWFYALTSEEWSGLESDGFTEVLQVTVSGNGVSGPTLTSYAYDPAKKIDQRLKNFWTRKPRMPEVTVTPESMAGHFTLRWRESDGTISEDPIVNPRGPENRLVSVVNWVQKGHAEEAVFSLVLVDGGTVKIRIFNKAGRLVRELQETFSQGGPVQMRWDATNKDGARVASDVYMADIYVNDTRIAKSQRLAVVK
ncbi:MAG: hypothetical protein LHV69_03485 [Elusimicrobia bacterium]|nr:hypothetical protein [Candidatus Obscuribacterium magneticum]